MKYRKKPVVIEAEQWTPDEHRDSLEAIQELQQGSSCLIVFPGDGSDDLIVKTPEGDMRASPGDWIIKGIKGELYPCKPDIFERTYDPEPAE